MDSGNKKVSIIAETVQGTTPTTPAFLTLRDTTTAGAYARPFGESPERRNDGTLAATTKQNTKLAKTITMPLAYETGLNLLFQSFFASAWSTNAIQNGVTPVPLTVEEVEEAPAATPGPWFWSRGCVVDQFQLTANNGKECNLVFNLAGFTEGTGSAAIAGATYTAPGVDDPITPIDIAVNSVCGLTPKMMNMTLTAKRNIKPQYDWGAADAYRTGFGAFRVDLTAEFYFSALSEYTAFNNALGTLDLTFGSVTNRKYELILPNAKWFSPERTDGGNSGDTTIKVSAMALYDAGTGAAMKLLRAVA